MTEEKVFKDYEEAQEYFDTLSDKATRLKIEFPKGSKEIKKIAFFKPDCTLQEQNDFEEQSEENKEASENANFIPKKHEKEGRIYNKAPSITELESNNPIYKARMSGKLNNGRLYWTTFFKHKNDYHPYVITEDRKVIPIIREFEKIKNKIIPIGDSFFDYGGVRYEYESELFFKDSFRVNKVSKNVLHKLKIKIDKKELHKRVITKVKEYYDHSNPIEYELIFPFIVVTYICWGIGRTYYLMIQGKEDTGKSTLQESLAKLQMNGWFGGKGSVPFMVRLKHFLGISANQDELEKMHKEEKTNFIGVANTGYSINGTYNFVNTNKRNIAEQMQVLNSFGTNSFSVNSLNLSWDFDKSFLSRCYLLMATRKNRKTKDITNLSKEESEQFQELTDDLFVYCLTNFTDIEKDIISVKNELEQEGTFGRLNDTYSIILGIIKHFKGNHSKEKAELLEKEGLSKIEEVDTIEGAIFNYLSGMFTKKESVTVMNKDICNFVNLQLGLPDDKKLKPRTVGAIFRRFNLTTRQDQIKRTGEGYEYTIGFNQFIDMLQRFGYKNQLKKIEEIIPDLSSLSSGSSEQNEFNEDNEGNESTPDMKYKVTKNISEFIKLDGSIESSHEVGEMIELPSNIADILIGDNFIKK